jgi:hypothetical protein
MLDGRQLLVVAVAVACRPTGAADDAREWTTVDSWYTGAPSTKEGWADIPPERFVEVSEAQLAELLARRIVPAGRPLFGPCPDPGQLVRHSDELPRWSRKEGIQMQKYMFLFRGGDAARAASSPEEMQQHLKKWGAWFQGLGGKFLGGEPLELSGKVLSGSKKALSDGPFAEAKDLVGGYAIVSTETLDAAVEIARGCPIFEHDGILEVRPVREMQM